MISEHFAALMKLCLLYKFIPNIFTLVPAYFWMTEPFWVAFSNNQSAVSMYHVYLCPQCSQSELVWKVFRHQILNNQIWYFPTINSGGRCYVVLQFGLLNYHILCYWGFIHCLSFFKVYLQSFVQKSLDEILLGSKNKPMWSWWSLQPPKAYIDMYTRI